MGLRPLGILETSLYVTDLQKAEKFYTHILGLVVHSKKEGRHVFFTLGNGMLLLFSASESSKETELVPPHGTKGAGHIAFSIEHSLFDTWREHLREKGVVIEKEVDWSDKAHSIYFRDPSDNSIELTTPITWDVKS